MWIQTNQPSVWNKHSLFDTLHDSWCHLTLAAALWTRCVEHSLQRDPVAGLVSKLLTPPWILPINTQTQMLTTHTHTPVQTHENTHNESVSTYSAITLLGSKSRPVPWLTAFMEKDSFTLSPWTWWAEEEAVNFLLCVCTSVTIFMRTRLSLSPLEWQFLTSFQV